MGSHGPGLSFPWLRGFTLTILGRGLKCCLFSPLPGEMIQVEDNIFQMGGSTTN